MTAEKPLNWDARPGSSVVAKSVVFEETGEEREIRRECARCQASELSTYGVTDFGIEIVSPNGTAHLGDDYGHTLCGIDATPNGWWHRV